MCQNSFTTSHDIEIIERPRLATIPFESSMFHDSLFSVIYTNASYYIIVHRVCTNGKVFTSGM